MSIAETLDAAQTSRTAVTSLPELDGLDVPSAYTVQADAFERRLKRGELASGLKLGFTSKAKMIQMGVDDVIWGRLTSGMQVDDGGTLDLSRFIHP